MYGIWHSGFSTGIKQPGIVLKEILSETADSEDDVG
jgi:hypothetical protein